MSNVRHRKIINEIEKDIKEKTCDVREINNGNLSQKMAVLINDYNIHMFDADLFNLEMMIKKLIKEYSLMSGLIIINLEKIFNRYFLWRKYLPDIVPFYAVKSCNDPVLIQTLYHLGVSFDIASQGELILLRELGIEGNVMVYANPVKQDTHISNAKSEGVEYFTFDSTMELQKISTVYPKSKLILRICVDDSNSLIKFSSKFGCPSKNYDKIFTLAKSLALNIVGASFHVGSGCTDILAHRKAIEDAKKVFEIAEKYDYFLDILDIGGGFPGKEEENEIFIEMTKNINLAIKENFSEYKNLKIWAEPGRFFSTSIATLIFMIIGKNDCQDENERKINYTVNTSVYSTVSNKIFDHAKIEIKVLSNIHDTKTYNGLVFGQSCDSIDVIYEGCLPELDYKDICYSENMGAYTMASSSEFNGFELPNIVYIYPY